MAKRHRDAGEAFEASIDSMHAVYAAQGRAWVRRVGTPMKVMGATKKDARGRTVFRACFDGEQGADFVGFLPGGRHVSVEAKSHADRAAWMSGVRGDGSLGSGAMGEAQWSELRAVEAAGGLALVLLRAWGAVWAFVPSRLVAHSLAVGRTTVRPEEAADVGRRLDGLDWLAR